MIISDSTTLIILSDLKRLDLLTVFEKVFIPQKVYEEVIFKNDIDLPEFIEIIESPENELLSNIKRILDDGESEAITLAVEKKLPLIIDEKKGRKIAKNLGIEIIGLLGILYFNYKKSRFSKNEIEEFSNIALPNGYRISDRLLKQFFESID
ncbi:DUF3368 domain-containing protein [Nautilia lithotrophica]